MFNKTLCLLYLFCLPVFAQKEAANWYFGNYAGLNFNYGSPPVALTDGQLSQLEGCATISDVDGNLLFYTNGINVYNANHLLMLNGAGLLGSQSSTQSAIIIPAPGNPERYYIFAVDSEGGANGLTYSAVDMTLDNNMGGIIATEKNIALIAPVAEKITATYHSNGEDIWVIAHGLGTNGFLSYLVTASGVNTVPQVSDTGVVHASAGGLGAIGYMKASPNGQKLAVGKLIGPGLTQLFDFDTTTGSVSNPINVNTYATYGVEFSSDSKVLYTTSTGYFSSPIYQYNIALGSEAAIQSSQVCITPGIYNFTALQLGIDGKIYTISSGGASMNVIQNPGEIGLGCNFEQDVVSLEGKTSSYGLPPFIQNYFQYEIHAENMCYGFPTQLKIETRSVIASAFWNFGDIGSGPDNTSTEIEPEHIFSSPGTYEVSVDFITDSGYVVTLSDSLTIFPSPVANTVQNMTMCDSLPNDGFSSFALSDQTDTILGAQPPGGHTVTYYTTEDVARLGENPLPSTNFTNTENPQTIYARVTNTETGCYDITSFDLIVNPIPTITAPDNLSACEEKQGQGIATFDLTQAIPQITGGNDQLDVIFYMTANNLLNNIPITTPESYINTTPESGTVYFKALDPDTPDCIATGQLGLTVNPIPDLNNNIADYVLCDINNPGDGIETFDLTTKYSEVANEPGHAMTYSYEEAGGLVTIDDPTSFENTVPTQQVIYVSTQNEFTCQNTTSFIIRVAPLPVVDTQEPFFACEEQAGLGLFDLEKLSQSLINTTSGFTITYYDTPEKAGLGGTDYLPTPYLTGDTTLYPRITDDITGCYTTGVTVELNVIPAPIATPPAPLEECDFNNDGFAQFDMTGAMAAIEAALGNVEVTAYETPEDAEHDVNPIPNPGTYTNINQNGQTIYLRVQSTLTDCYDLVTLELIVNPVPEATEPSDYALCDDGASDTDGIATFDLTIKAAEILGTLDPAQYSISYHVSLADAQDGTPSIINAASYPSGTAPIYVRVTNNTTGCYDIVILELIVNPLPELITNQSVYTLCDTTAPMDKEVFDLTSRIPDFIADASGMTITFHHSFADAQGDANPISEADALAYENQVPQVETLFVRFEVTATGCYRIGFLDLRVEHQPIILEPTQDELTVCDTNGQGIGEFDLKSLEESMANGDPDLVITFHETAEDAIAGINPIPTTENYVNAVPYIQDIYVRVTDTRSGCSNNVPYVLTLIVSPAPQAPSLEDLTFCDDADNNGQDGKRRVDLTVQNAVIADALGLTIPDDLIVEYYTTETGANSGLANRITNPATYIGSDQQVIWVRVEDPVTGCYSVESFMLIFNAPHALTTPSPLAICNEALPNDGQTEFDLTVREDQLLGPSGIGQGYTVEYYESDPRVDTGAIAIADPEHYTNPAPPQGNPKTLFVKVTTQDGCVSYTTLTIKVLPLPTPDTTPDALVLCDDNGDGDGVEEFDLTQAAADIKDNGSNYILTYYTTEEDAQNEVNPIADPSAYESGSGSVWVRVSLDTHNPAEPMCAQIVELPLIVNPLPPVADLEPFAHCEQNTDGAYDFNIQEYVNNALGGNEAGQYDVDFFADAALTTPAVPVTAYPVTGGSGTVYVRVTNNDTGCMIVKELSLLVEEGAIANPVTTVFNECDYDGANDGIISTWDLTVVEGEVLGTQDPAGYEVTYYTSLEDAENYENAIATPEAYTNTIADDQTIWVRVTNTATLSKCHDITTFTLHVERLAEPVITGENGSNTVCIDIDGTTDGLLLDSGVAPAGHSYRWFLDGVELTDADPSSGTYLALSEGDYTVEVTGPLPNACVSDLSAVFTVIKSGMASPVGAGYYVTNYFSDNQIITITVEGNGEYVYQLDEGPTQTSPVFTNVSPGPHTVRVYDVKTEFSCGVLPIEGVSVVDYPNFFTPNGDGFHDTWNIIGLQNTGSVIYIFDRYGKLIKQISPDLESDGWDGTFNGTPLPADDYWFSVTYPEFDGTTTVTREFKAHFSLKR